jgi:hypothetical protein
VESWEINMIALNRSKNSVYRLLGCVALLVSATGAAHAQFTNIVDPANPTFTQALGINNANKIVGYGNTTTFNGFTLSLPPVAGNFTRLNFPGADGGTQVIGISNGASPTTVGFYVNGGATNGSPTPAAKAGRSPRSMLPASHSRSCSALITTATPPPATGQLTPPEPPDR